MTKPLYECVIECMTNCRIRFEESAHEPVFTSEAASKVSLHPEEQGTKSLVLQTTEGRLVVVTVCGDERVDFNRVRRGIGVKKVKMCDEHVLSSQLGTELGGVAPFGYAPGVVLVVSPRLFSQEAVYFNGGRNDVTFKVSGLDFQKVMEAYNVVVLPSSPDRGEADAGNT